MARALEPGSRSRRLVIGLVIWAACTAVYFAAAPRERIGQHTSFNHFALLADGWLHGRLDLPRGAPSYAQNNDFADFRGKTFVSFPPFPAVVLLPVAAVAKTPENLRDGQVWLWLAGVGPAILFLALEKIRRSGRGAVGERGNAALALLFAFGTVYFFTAEQGTVWFAAHIVGVALAAMYLLFALDADHPLLAGIALGLGFATRTPLLFAFPLFAVEAIRASAGGAWPDGGSPRGRFAATWRALDGRALVRRVALFALPVAAVIAATLWHNHARFGSPWEFGHRLLTVGWRPRIDRWGLFSYHYLARNLGVVLTSLPWANQVPAKFQINTHGLALWLTTPAYLWLIWPRRTGALWWALLGTAAAVALPDLLYQNTGWLQFGYRFSNDFAVFLFALLAIGGWRMGLPFRVAAVWAIGVNTFGALTFDRASAEKYYFTDTSQRTIYQPD